MNRSTNIPSHGACFYTYLAAFVFVKACLSIGRTWRAWILVVVLTSLQPAIVTAAIRRGEMCVPQVLSQRTLWTGIKEPFPLGLLYGHLGVPHPSSYLHGGKKKCSCLKSSLDKLWFPLTFASSSYCLQVHTDVQHKHPSS